MLGKRVRHINRYKEIVSALTRHGFGFLVEEMGLFQMLSIPKKLFKNAKEHEPVTVGARMRMVLQELGPTFIKLGQLLSTRPDIFPDTVIYELDKLQERVAPFSFLKVKDIISSELGEDVDELFYHFEETPLAAASIGQVHSAILNDQETKVIMKVQRPEIRSVIETDLEILRDLARMAESRFEFAKQYNLREVVDEFAISIRKELDYTLEARNAEKFSEIFKGNPDIYIPEVYWEFTTNRVISLEFVDGVNLNQYDQLVREGYDTRVIARKLTEAFLNQVLFEGFFHGDPHPGNFLILPDNRIAFTDFGIVGQLTPDMKKQFASLVIAVIRKDTEAMVKVIMKMGFFPSDVNMQRVKKDAQEMRDKYYHLPLKKVSFGEAIQDFFQLAYRHKIQIPSDLTMLGKTFLTLEGVVGKLDPDLSVVEIAEPFGRKLAKDRFKPQNLLSSMIDNIYSYGEILLELPGELKELTTSLRRGRLGIEMHLPHLDPILKKLDTISNKLSFSIVLLSFSIIMAGLIIGSSIGEESIMLWQIPAVEIGFIIALGMFFWLLFSIFKSGRF